MDSIPDSAELGALGVAHLKRLWARRRAMWRSEPVRNETGEWLRDKLLIHGLGVGLEQMATYLREPRRFEELEEWILELNRGTLARARIDRLNAALLSQPYDAHVLDDLASRDAHAPVLDAEDLAFWHRHGYVVLHDAISSDECAAAAQAVCASVGADPENPETWYSRRNMQGIMVQMFQDPAFERARTSPRIHKAFAQLWGTPDLFPTCDRGGFNPPERGGFRFPGPRLHWDAQLVPPVGVSLQGILYLTDTSEQQGAFTCIPGFHHDIDDWLRGLPRDADPYGHIPTADARPIAGRAGDLIIWHHALPHGSSPNNAAVPRIVQYLTMFPPPDLGLETG